MTKYERINRAKLTDKGKAVYDKLSKATDGFKDKEAVKKNKAVLDKFYDRVKSGLPEAIKPVKSKKSKAKPKAKAKKPAYKNVNMGNFAKETSALAKKEGISYKEAQKKMSAIYKERKAKAQKKQGSDFDKMIAGLKKKVEYRGGRGLGDVKERGKMRKLDLKKDAKIDALKFGKRTSKGTGANQYGKAKKGRIYYEYRNNRADVKNAPPSQPYPKLESGGKISEAGDVDFPEKLLGYAKGGMTDVDQNLPKEINRPILGYVKVRKDIKSSAYKDVAKKGDILPYTDVITDSNDYDDYYEQTGVIAWYKGAGNEYSFDEVEYLDDYAKGGDVKTYNQYYKLDKVIDGVPYTKQGEYKFKEKAIITSANDFQRNKTKIVKEGNKYILYVHYEKRFSKGGEVKLKEISTPQLYSILKLKFTKSIQTNTDYKVGNDVYYIRDGFGSKRLDDDKLYLYKKTRGGNELIGVLTTTYAKGGEVKDIEKWEVEFDHEVSYENQWMATMSITPVTNLNVDLILKKKQKKEPKK